MDEEYGRANALPANATSRWKLPDGYGHKVKSKEKKKKMDLEALDPLALIKPKKEEAKTTAVKLPPAKPTIKLNSIREVAANAKVERFQDPVVDMAKREKLAATSRSTPKSASSPRPGSSTARRPGSARVHPEPGGATAGGGAGEAGPAATSPRTIAPLPDIDYHSLAVAGGKRENIEDVTRVIEPRIMKKPGWRDIPGVPLPTPPLVQGLGAGGTAETIADRVLKGGLAGDYVDPTEVDDHNGPTRITPGAQGPAPPPPPKSTVSGQALEKSFKKPKLKGIKGGPVWVAPWERRDPLEGLTPEARTAVMRAKERIEEARAAGWAVAPIGAKDSNNGDPLLPGPSPFQQDMMIAMQKTGNDWQRVALYLNETMEAPLPEVGGRKAKWGRGGAAAKQQQQQQQGAKDAAAAGEAKAGVPADAKAATGAASPGKKKSSIIPDATKAIPKEFDKYRSTQEVGHSVLLTAIDRRKLLLSRCRLVTMYVPAIFWWLGSFYNLVSSFLTIDPIRPQPSWRFHYLGQQGLWNTQPLSIVFDLPGMRAKLAPFVLQVACSMAILGFRGWRIWTHEEDYTMPPCRGMWTKRSIIGLCLNMSRIILVLACIGVFAEYRTIPVPPIIDQVFESTCTLHHEFIGDPKLSTLMRTGPGGCLKELNNDVLDNEWTIRGQVPTRYASDTFGSWWDSRYVTMIMVPVGTENGCPADITRRGAALPLTTLYGAASASPGRVMTSWMPYEVRPLRYCYSRDNYYLSNWRTTALDCDATSYTKWYGPLVAVFEHFEQWYCGVRTTTTGRTSTVEYASAGWPHTVVNAVGPGGVPSDPYHTSCAADEDWQLFPQLAAWLALVRPANHSAPSVPPWSQPPASIVASWDPRGNLSTANRFETPAAGAAPRTNLTRAFAFKDVPQAWLRAVTFLNTSDAGVAARTGAALGGAPPTLPVELDGRCAEIRVGCMMTSGAYTQRYLRSLSFHGCTQSFTRPMTTAEYKNYIDDQLDGWSYNLSVGLGLAILEVIWDILDGILFAITL